LTAPDHLARLHATMLATHRSLRFGLYALLAAILYLPALGRPALWEPDEGRYAEIAREMVVSGDYVTPRDDYELYFEKPPLVYWAEAVTIKIFGVDEFAVRLPAAMFSIGQVVITASLAEAMLGASAGFLAALVLALSPLFFALARFATLDPALAFFLTAALAAFYAASQFESFASVSARRWLITSSAMLALGTLCKGPVALVLGVAIIFIWLASERRVAEIRRMPLLWSAIVYIAIVAPWFVLIEARNPGFLNFFFIHEHLQRYVSSNEHGWGPWFFIPIVVGGTWPWIFFAPTGWSAMHSDGVRSGSGSERQRSAATFLGIWFAVIFVFFSIPRSKLGTYILPALPPLAIVAGCGLSRLGSIAADSRRRLLASVAIANLILALAGIVVLGIVLRPINPSLALDGFLVSIAIAAGGVLMYALGREAERARYAIGALALAMLAIVPLTNRAREDAAPWSTYRNLAHIVQPYLAGDCALASYRHYIQSLPFYTGRRETRVLYWGELSEVDPAAAAKSPFIIDSDAHLDQIWSSHGCMILIANERDLPTLRKSLKPAPSMVGFEGKKFALYNGAVAPPSGAEPQTR
jgi:4-amino-4-deoxy-L-arabinose transferase-like glycosyltransferase